MADSDHVFEPPAYLVDDLVAAGRRWWEILTPYEQVFYEVLVASDGPVTSDRLVEEMSSVDHRVKAPLGPWINKAIPKANEVGLWTPYNLVPDRPRWPEECGFWHSSTNRKCAGCRQLKAGEFSASRDMRWLVPRILDPSTRPARATVATKDPDPQLFTVYYDGDAQDEETFLLASRETTGADVLANVEVYSLQSPLGAAVRDATPGESVTYTGPTGRQIEVTIISVQPHGDSAEASPAEGDAQ